MIEKGGDVDSIGKMIDLYERMEKRRAMEEFTKAMNAAQLEMPVVVRDRENIFTKAWYATLEAVNNRIKPVYSRHGLSLSFGEGESKREGMIHIYCDVFHVGGHCQRYEGDFPLDKAGSGGKDNKTAIQATGSTRSYASRYLILGIFNITVADEDNDGNATDPLVTEDQIAEVNGLLDECRECGQEVELARFLKWMGIASLDRLTQNGFAKAIHELNRKRRLGKAKVAK